MIKTKRYLAIFAVLILICGYSINILANVKPYGAFIIDAQEVRLQVNGLKQLRVTIVSDEKTKGKILYSSSNTNVAQVNSQGLIKAVGEGIATINIEYPNRNVKNRVAVKVTKDEVVPEPKFTVTGKLIEEGGDVIKNRNILLQNSYAISNKKTDDNGEFRFDSIKPGAYELYVYDGQETNEVIALGNFTTPKEDVNIIATVSGMDISFDYKYMDKLSDFSLSSKKVNLAKNQTHQIQIEPVPTNAQMPKFSAESSNINVATVNEGGLITAINNGEAKITFRLENGLEKVCVVNVGNLESSQYSLVIIIIEGIILLAVALIFIFVYRKFIKERHKKEKL